MAQQIASVYAKIGADTSGLDKGLAGTKKKLGGVAGTLGKVAAGATAALGVAFVTGARKAAMVAGDFESQMNTLTIAARASGTSMQTLSAAALAVGGDTRLVGISAAESALAMEDFYKAGLTTTEIFGDLNGFMNEGAELSGALRAAIDLQAASELDLASASDTVAIAMATFGLSADEAGSIADNFVRTADASVSSVGELAASMVNVGPTAAAYGWSLESVNNALGILSQRGIKGSEAGTALKSMMTNIMRGTNATEASLQALNVSLYDTEGVMNSLPNILGQIESGMAGMTDEQRNAHIQTLAGTFGMKAMNTLLAEGTEGWAAMEVAVGNAASVQESATARTKGFNAAMETLDGVVETFLIKVGTPLIQKFLTPLVGHLTKGIEWLMNFKMSWSDINKTLTGALAGPMSKIGPFIQEVGQIWDRAWVQIKTIAKMVLNDVGPFIIKIVGEATTFFKTTFKGVIDWFVANLPLIKRTVTTVLLAVVKLWGDVWPHIRDTVITIWEIIKVRIETTINAVLGIIKTVMLLIEGDWDGAWTEIQNVATGVWDGIKTMVAIAVDYLKEKISVIWTKLQPKLAETWDKIKLAAGKSWDALKIKAETVWTSIKDFIKDNIETAKTKAGEAWDTIQLKTEEAFTAVETAVTTAIQTVIDTVTALPTTLSTLVTDFYNQAVALGQNIAAGVADGISGFVQKAKAAAVGVVQKAWAGVKSWAGIRSPSQKFAELGYNMAAGLAEGMSDSRAIARIGRGVRAMVGELGIIMAGKNASGGEGFYDFGSAMKVGRKSAEAFQGILGKLGMASFNALKTLREGGGDVDKFARRLAEAGGMLANAFKAVESGEAWSIDWWQEMAQGFGLADDKAKAFGDALFKVGLQAKKMAAPVAEAHWLIGKMAKIGVGADQVAFTGIQKVNYPGGGDLFDFVKRNNKPSKQPPLWQQTPHLSSRALVDLTNSLWTKRAKSMDALASKQPPLWQQTPHLPSKELKDLTNSMWTIRANNLAVTSAVAPSLRNRATTMPPVIKVEMNLNGTTLDTREDRLQVVRRLQQEIKDVMQNG